MPDLSDQIQCYIDGIAEPITVAEVREEDPSDLAGGSERSLGPGRQRNRWLVGAAAVAVVVVLAGLFGLRDDEPDGRLDVGPGTSSSMVTIDPTQPVFELLDMREATEEMGSLHAAVDDSGMDALWTAIGFGGGRPAVDFSRWVVVSMTIPDDACPPALSGFDRAGSTWTPRFVEPGTGCEQPLVPKTYVVAINRTEVQPSFTLRLPVDEYFIDEEQLLPVDVPAVDGAAPTTVAAPAAVESVGRVPLPPLGEARSSIVDRGRPVWVVHHIDGSVTAVPGIVAGNARVDGLAGLWSLVRWSPEGSFHGAIAWDAWGRAITGGRQADLTDFTAHIDGDDVVIESSDGARVPGEPVVPDHFGLAPIDPELPRLVDLALGLPEGWSQIDATVVGSGGIARLCPVDPVVPVNQLATCPPGSPEVDGLVPSPGYTTWNFGPLVVEADRGGRIIHVVALGGQAGRADG